MAIKLRTKREDKVENEKTRKGILQEPESIELYSKFRGEQFEKNIIRLDDGTRSGEFDLDEKDRKGKRERIIDIKTRWSVFTFFEHFTSGIDKKEAAQLEDYCILADCEEAEIANVLTNNHPDEIERILYYESLKWRDPNDPDKLIFEVPLWRKIQILKDHVFDFKTLDKYISGEYMDDEAREEYESFVEIPLEERVIREVYQSNPELREQIKAAHERGKKYLREVWNVYDYNDVLE